MAAVAPTPDEPGLPQIWRVTLGQRILRSFGIAPRIRNATGSVACGPTMLRRSYLEHSPAIGNKGLIHIARPVSDRSSPMVLF